MYSFHHVDAGGDEQTFVILGISQMLSYQRWTTVCRGLAFFLLSIFLAVFEPRKKTHAQYLSFPDACFPRLSKYRRNGS